MMITRMVVEEEETGHHLQVLILHIIPMRVLQILPAILVILELALDAKVLLVEGSGLVRLQVGFLDTFLEEESEL
jgi:hypothetical protein